MPGLYIAEIQRENGIIAAAKPNERLRANDVLILVGALESVVDLRKIRGLTTSDDQARKLQVPAWRRTLVEAVVSTRCALLGKTIRQGQFRSHYNAAVVAVARGDKKLTENLVMFVWKSVTSCCSKRLRRSCIVAVNRETFSWSVPCRRDPFGDRNEPGSPSAILVVMVLGGLADGGVDPDRRLGCGRRHGLAAMLHHVRSPAQH